MDVINNRRSIRSYKEVKIENEKIEALLRAAMQAPSAGNQQPWEFIVVTNPEILKSLSTVSPFAGLIADAPLAIILLSSKNRLKKPAMWQQDMAAATQNLLLEAVSQDLGAVWIGVSPLEERIVHVNTVLQLDENKIPFCIVALGYPAEGHENKYIDRYDPSRVTYLE